MALLKSVKAIEPLIPKPSNCPYMSMITHTPQKALLTNVVYAVEISSKENKIDKIYRVEFSIFNSPGASYLFINDKNKELSSDTNFVKGKNENGKEPTIDDWGFEIDNIGLKINAGTINKTTIYFCTSHLDLIEIKKGLKLKENKNILVVETVYI